MGKGDKRSKRGKIFKGSFGNSRPHKVKKKSATASTAKSTATAKSEAPKKKAAPKKKKKEESAE